MTKLTYHDLQFALMRCPRELLLTMKSDAFLGKVFVGGGFLRSIVAGEHINDVDIFTPSKSEAKTLAEHLVRLRLKKKIERLTAEEAEKRVKGSIYETDNALTLTCFEPTLQIIHRWTFADPHSVVTSFDFTCCCAAFWFDQSKTWQSVCDPRFYPDIAAKRLIYRAPARVEDAGGSMLRVLKYYQKGYRIPIDSLGSVIARVVAGVNLKNQLDSNDGRPNEAFLAKVVTGLLREVDPAIDPRHVAHLPAEETANPNPETMNHQEPITSPV
jgi:hypothetical protein